MDLFPCQEDTEIHCHHDDHIRWKMENNGAYEMEEILHPSHMAMMKIRIYDTPDSHPTGFYFPQDNILERMHMEETKRCVYWMEPSL